jgi:hypothetical protein
MELKDTVKAEYDKIMVEIGKMEADLKAKKEEIKPLKAYLQAQGVIPKAKRQKKKAE